MFGSFSVVGLRNIIVQNDEKIVKKKIFGMEKLTSTDNKLTVGQTFSQPTYEKLKVQEKERWQSVKQQEIFIKEFGNLVTIKEFVNLVMFLYKGIW